MALQNITGIDTSKPVKKIELGGNQSTTPAATVDYSQPYEKIELGTGETQRFTENGKQETNLLQDVGDVGRGFASGLVGDAIGRTFSGVGEMIGVADRSIARGLDAVLPDALDPIIHHKIPNEYNPLYHLTKGPGEALKEAGRQIGPEESRRGFHTDVAGGLGQMTGQVATVLLGGPAASGAALAGQGADIMAESVADDDAPQANKDLAIMTGAGITAMLEKTGLDILLNRVPPNIKNRAMRYVTDLGMAGGYEAIQEAAEGLSHDLTRYILTNDEVEIGSGLPYEAGVAGTTGSIARGAVLTAAGVKRRPDQTQDDPIIQPAPQEQSIEEWAAQEGIQLPKANLEPGVDRIKEAEGQITPPGDVPVAGELRQAPLPQEATPAPPIPQEAPIPQDTPPPVVDQPAPIEPGSVAEMQQVIDNPDTPIDEITAGNDGFSLIDVDTGEGTDSEGQVWFNEETGEFREYIEGQPALVALPQALDRLGAEVVREGTKTAPVTAQTVDDVRVAESNANPEPTDAQKEAGNYQKGHVKIQGLDITIENAKGSQRRGVDDKGNPWEVTMPATYGYVKRTNGADGDQVDVYVGDDPMSQDVYVIDQVDPVTKKFDEHKVMIGFGDKDAAASAYIGAFSDDTGRARAGGATRMRIDEFRDWLAKGKTTEPLSANVNALQKTPRPRTPLKRPKRRKNSKPQSLLQRIADYGGLRDEDGELSNMNAELWHKDRKFQKRLVNPKSTIHIDDMAEAVWVDGYFPNHQERPDINELLEAIDMELRGREIYTTEGYQQLAELKEKEDAARLEEEAKIVNHADTLGVDYSELRNIDEVVEEIVENLASRADGLSEDQLLDEYKKISQDIAAFTNNQYPDAYSATIADRQETEFDIPFGNEKDESSISTQPEADSRSEQDGRDAEQSEGQKATEEPGEVSETTKPDSEQSSDDLTALYNKLGDPKSLTPQALYRIQKRVGDEFAKDNTLDESDQMSAEEFAALEEYARQIESEIESRGKEEMKATLQATTEKTDQGDQTVIPGAERISDKDLAERKMSGRKKSDKPQKDADDGLFDTGSRKQTDLLDTPQKETEPTSITHVGQKIYETRVGDQDYWAVQDERNVGTEKVLGDTLHDNLDEAKAQAERNKKDQDYKESYKQKQKEEDATAAAKRTENKSKNITERKRDAYLDSLHSKGGVQFAGMGKTNRDFIEAAIKKGWEYKAVDVYDSAAKKRDQTVMDNFKRKGYILGATNENLPDVKKARAAKARLEENKYSKPEYRLYIDDNRFINATKTEHEYAKLTSKADVNDTEESSEPQQDIADFGEKIGGARKDVWTGYKDKLDADLPDDIKKVTLSKSFPEPDYQKFIDAGVPVETLAAIKVFRDEIPAKPRHNGKLVRWVDGIKTFRGFSKNLLDGSITMDRLMEKLSEDDGRTARTVKSRIELYKTLGYPAFTKAKGYSVGNVGVLQKGPDGKTDYSKDPIHRWVIEKGYSSFNRQYFDTKQEAIDALRDNLLSDTGKKPRKTKLDIYRVTRTGDIVVGKKVAAGKFIDLKTGFKSYKEAAEYYANNEQSLLDTLEKKKNTEPMRRSVNNPRIGPDYREGVDITPESFDETFGFRGVEFGNYVEQKKRIRDLNNAYDSLLDLSTAINVPAQALSLNGTLGLAFGARGRGGRNAAAAHYEPGFVAINLTKNAGAGSLAHEWWHALDNNFGKRQPGGEMLTAAPRAKRYLDGDQWVESDAIRPEIIEAFAGIMKALKKDTGLYERSKELDRTRTKDYFSTDVEMSARAFEAYIIHMAREQGLSNDYLANIISEEALEAHNSIVGEEFADPYPYPTIKEVEEHVAPAFDKLFKTIKSKKTDKGVMLFQRTDRQKDGERGVRVKRVATWNKKKAKIANRAKRLAAQSFGAPLKLKYVDSITANDGTVSNGLYFAAENESGQLENMALIAMRQDNPTGTITSMGHEGIHFLREMGALDKVWKSLSRKAESEWIEKYNIRELYKTKNEAVIVEEAIAEAYADWLGGRISVTGKIKATFDKMKKFFQGLAGILSDNNVKRESDIFERIYQGDFAVASNKRYTVNNTSIKHSQVEKGSDVPQFSMSLYDSKTKEEIGSARYIKHGDAELIIESIDAPAELIGNNVESAIIDHIKKKAAGRAVRFSHSLERLSKIEQRLPELAYRFQKSLDPHQNTDKMEFEYGDQTVFKALFDQNKTMWDRIKGASSRDAVQGSIDNARMQLQDRFLGFTRIQQVIERHNGKPLDDSMNVYQKQELFSGRAGDKLELLNKKHIDPIHDAISDYAKKRTGSNWKKAVEQIEEYIYARHAKERNQQIAKINKAMPDAGSGMSTEAANKILAAAEDAGTKADLEAISRRVRSMLDYQLKIRVEMGLMDEKTAMALKNKYPNYVPLRGVEEMGDVPDGMPNTGKGFSVKGEESRRALGRETRAHDILANSLSIAEEAMIRGEKNRVTEALRKLVEANPNPKLWEINKVDRVRVLNKATGLIEYRAKPLSPGTTLDKKTVYGKRDGNPYRITIHDPRLYEVIKNLDVDQLDGAWKALMAINRYLSHTHTGWNPEFIITNAFRDLQTGMINLQQYDQKKLARNTFKDYPKALLGAWYGVRGKDAAELPKWIKKTLKKEGVADDKLDSVAEEWVTHFREFAKSGGKVSFFKLDSVAEKRNKMAKELNYRQPGTKAFMKRQARAAFEWVEYTNQAIENAIRLSAFVNARKAGMDVENAAQLAKNLTVNFNKRGKMGPKLNALFLFYNASIQGSAVMFKALQSKKVQKIAGGIIAAGVMSDVLNAMMSDEDDDGQLLYDKIPLYEKESNMIFMLPRGYMPDWLKSAFSYGKIDDVYYLKLPMPYGYRMFHEIGRNVSMSSRGAQEASTAGANILFSVANNFNPMGGTESFLNFVTPTIGDPIIDIMATNKKFTGAPINPPDNPFKHYEGPDSRRFYRSTSLESRAIASGLNDLTGGNEFKPGLIDIHPGTVDYLFHFAVGSAGAFVDRTANALGKQFTGEELEIHEIPMARKLLGGSPSWINTTNFYNRKNVIETLHGEWTGFNKVGNTKKAAELWESHGELIRMYGKGTKQHGTAKFVAKKLSDFRKQESYIREDDSLTAEQKRNRLKGVEEQKSKLINSFNRRYLEAAGKSASRTRSIIHNITGE